MYLIQPQDDAVMCNANTGDNEDDTDIDLSGKYKSVIIVSCVYILILGQTLENA